MKTLICAVIVVGALLARADEQPKPEAAASTAAAVAKEVPKRPQPSSEQRAKMREQRVKLMVERKAQMEAKILEIVKKYVPEEEKAKALAAELRDELMPSRRNILRRPQRQRPPAAPKHLETK